MLAVACASILGMVPVAPTTQRVSLREELLTLLPAGPPHSIEGRAEELVRELELLENVPATPDFLLFGLSGAWVLRGANVPTDHASGRDEADDFIDDTSASLSASLLDVTQKIDLEALSVSSVARFSSSTDAAVTEALQGTLSLDASIRPDPERADTLQFVIAPERRLSLPRAPSGAVVSHLMKDLHTQLPAEFLGEDGVRLGMQTTYLDEVVRITRCTTRSLATACTVHVRDAGA